MSNPVITIVETPVKVASVVAAGIRGPRGYAATIDVGTVASVPTGSPATITNTGDQHDAVFNFEIPVGLTGDAATIAVGTTTTGAAGTNATVTNTGDQHAAVFDFVIPQGLKGDKGDAATVAVGSTTTGAPGTNATVTNAGNSSAAVFNFTIPRGDKGETGTAATVAVGTTTTGAAGTAASVTNTGTSSAAVFNFTVPRGEQGYRGGILYMVDDSHDINNPPTGTFRFNNTLVDQVTHIGISATATLPLIDISDFLATLDDSTSAYKGTISFIPATATNMVTQAIFRVNSVTDYGTHLVLAVTYLSGQSELVGLEGLYQVDFTRTGDKGEVGATGPQGETGPMGPAGGVNSVNPSQWVVITNSTWTDHITTGDVTVNLLASFTNTPSYLVSRDNNGDIYASVLHGTAQTAQYADLAEKFETDSIYPEGTLVKFGGAEEVTQVVDERSDDVFGVVSSAPAFLMNSTQLGFSQPIALAGRVPVRVVGPVSKGDRLVSAGYGAARKAQPDEIHPAYVIGRALEDKQDSVEGLVLAFVLAKV